MAVVNNLLPRIIKSGLGVLHPVDGISALLGAVQASDMGPQLVVSPFNWSKLMAGAEGSVFPVFKEFEVWAKDPAVPALAPAAAAMPKVQTDVS